MGFTHVELSHGLRITQIEGMLKHLDRGTLTVTSVHNFCPQPIEVVHDAPDALEYSAYDARERRRAVRMTRETIDFAARVGAPKVVLHLGSMPLPQFEPRLTRLARQGALYSKEAVGVKLRAVRRREKYASQYWDRVFDCLREIVPHAAQRGVQLGAECRSSALDLPLEEEFDALWERFPGDTLGYWHDFGHMQRKHNLALGDHWEALSSRRHKIIGAHVHDTVAPVKDHQAVGTGTVAWTRLLAAVPRHITWVLELSPRLEPEQVLASRDTFLRLAADATFAEAA